MTSYQTQAAVEKEFEPEFIAPCTALQQRFLEIQGRDPDSTIANIAMRWRLVGAVRDKTMQAALKLLAQRHESLRTRFERGEDGFRQEVVECQIRLSLIDLSQLTHQRYQEEANRIARLEALTPFDPAAAPLWRAVLLRYSPREAILLVTFHHTIVDGWSIGVFARELAIALDALEQSCSPELPELGLQYGDYARWQEALLASEAVTEERQYWLRQMTGVVPMDVAATRAEPVHGRREGVIRSVVLPRELTDRLQVIARQQGHTVYSLAATCLAAALSRSLGLGQLVIGTQVGGRDDQLLLGVIGPTVNTVILRLDGTLASDLWAFASHVRTVVADALANKALPFDEIVAGARLSSQTDLPFGYEVAFTLQAANIDTDDVGSIRSGGVELVSIPSVSAGSLYDLFFFMVGRDEGWRISCEFNADRHEAAATDALIEAWRSELETLVNASASQGALQKVQAAEAPAEPPSMPRPLLRQPSRSYFQPCELYSEGKLPPVFALSQHSLYYPIARRVANDRPFVDLQWPQYTDPPPPVPDLFEDMAADAARQIRAFDPVGPYYLIGYCVLGNVVLETARQLRAAGSNVPVLFLLDTVAAGYIETMSRTDQLVRRLQRADRWLPDLSRRIRAVRAGDLSVAAALLQYPFIRETPLAPLLRRQLGGSAAANVGEDYSVRITDYLIQERKHYRPQPYPGDVVFFRASDARVGRLYARSFGWSEIVKGDLRVYDVPGVHGKMLHEGSAPVIAEHMAWMMDKAEGRWRTPPSQP